jgi:mannose-6-phosphate isomerase-like protein (cupin superfamily)
MMEGQPTHQVKGDAVALDPHALLIGPDDGTPTINPIGGRMVRKIPDGLTHGSYSIHDNVLPAGSPGPRPHRHLDHDEVFYVIEGTLAVRIDGERHTAGPGSFVVVPRGAVHQPSNPTADPVHVLLLFSPGGMDTFFLEAAERKLPLQAIPDDPAVLADLEAFTARYGYEFAAFDTP